MRKKKKLEKKLHRKNVNITYNLQILGGKFKTYKRTLVLAPGNISMGTYYVTCFIKH